MSHEPRDESHFVRRTLPITRDYGLHRNWWVRDSRLAGNPITIYLYLLSHDENYRITPKRVMHDLGLGRTAFMTARRVLEELGFLRAETVRHPAGARDAAGRSVAGQVIRTEFILDDPPEPAPRRGPAQQAVGFVHQLPIEPEGTAADARNLTSADLTPVEPAAAQLMPGSVLPKEDQDQEDQDQEDDDERAAPFASAARVEPALERRLRNVHPQLSIAELVDYVRINAPDVEVDRAALARAAVAIISRATQPVNDPVAYAGSSIIRQTRRWLQPSPSAPEPDRAGDLCAAAGHRYIGKWHEVCSRCGTERPGWRDDRDRSPGGLAS